MITTAENIGKTQKTPQELVARARQKRLLFDVPDYEEAVPLLKEAIELSPAYAPAYSELAETYAYWAFRREIAGQEHQSLYLLAHDCAETALKLDPRLPAAHRAMAVSLRRGPKADPQRRAKEVNEALALDPRDAESLCEKWRIDGYDPENPDLRRVLELSPGFIAVHIDLGAVLCELERFPEALSELQKAVELNPSNVQAYYDIAMTLDRMGLRQKALELLSKALRLRPEDPLLEQGRALLEET